MSGFLLDTHVLLWWADSPQKLSEEARVTIASGRNSLFFSHASVWEIHLKISRHKLRLPEPTGILLQRARCKPLPIAIPHIEMTSQLPYHHGDPFDRMLIAQAAYEKLRLITRDPIIPRYDIATLAA